MLALILDGLIVALLLAALGVGLVVYRRLHGLRHDYGELRQLIDGLDAAAGRAEAALGELRRTARDAGERLEADVATAQRLLDDLRLASAQADRLADRLAAGIRGAHAPRPPAGDAARQDPAGAPSGRDAPVSPAELEQALRALR